VPVTLRLCRGARAKKARAAATGISAGITGTAMITDMERALASLRELKALGRISMDDFGTGYSSLSTLRALPFDKIKIDRSFVRSMHVNEQSAAIFRAVFGLRRGLKLPVLAEGIEAAAELDFLPSSVATPRNATFSGVRSRWRCSSTSSPTSSSTNRQGPYRRRSRSAAPPEGMPPQVCAPSSVRKYGSTLPFSLIVIGLP
jgi:predicted signal transduction protein with EAL and GGDEF domain